MIDIEKLERDLLQAENAARAAKCSDDGTCNFDTLCINLGRNTKALRNALASIDWKIVSVGQRGWTGWYFVDLYSLCGMANCRTAMVEAAKNKMIELGWDACVYYMLD